MDAGGSPAAIRCRRPLHRSVLGQRLQTSTIESEAFSSCSDVLEHTNIGTTIAEPTSCEFPRPLFRRTESFDEGSSNACIHCGKMALPHPTLSRGVCRDTAHAQGTGTVVEAGPSSFSGSPCYNDPSYFLNLERFNLVRTFPERLQDLSVVLLSKFKYLQEDRSLCDGILPSDVVDAFDGRPPCSNALLLSAAAISEGGKQEEEGLGARIGILLFFRLLGSLRRNKNTAGILKLIKQVPSMISNTPLLYLSPHHPRLSRENQLPAEGPRHSDQGGVATAAGDIPDGVVEEITSAAEELLLGDEHELSDTQQGDVLGALVGLAVKRGSLAHCLRVVKLLLCSNPVDRPLPIHGVGRQLKELESTQTFVPADDAGVRHPGLSPSSEWFQAGILLSLDEMRDPPAESYAPNNRDPRAPFVAPALRGVKMIKVDSTASYNAALTVDGELLTWSRMATTTKQSIPPSMLDRSRNPQAWASESQGGKGCTMDADAGCTCSRCHTSSVWPTNGENAGHPTTPTVWQALACKPSVSDVACGHKHTLALLETGQVFSWGSGRNGQLGLGHTEDRPFACPVEALQGIDIEAVICGVFHSMAICSSGASYAWGKNSSGQCGRKDPVAVDALSPRIIEGLEEFPVTAMAGGWNHTLALSRCGAVFTIGGGNRDRCSTGATSAHGGTLASATPGGRVGEQEGALSTRVGGDALGSARVKTIASGWHHFMAVTDDGALFSWGSGRGGQLGHGDVEPRHSPTRVAFFSTPVGGRVCSVAGGRTCSAATTADGRLFKWGLKSRGSKHSCADEYMGEEAGSDPNEENGGAAMEASIPRQVAGVGREDSRALRVGGGANLDMVLVQPTSTADPKSALDSVHKEDKTNGHSTNELLLRSGLSVPDDPSQPVGRVETAVALLRHFERLAIPHIPKDFTAQVERSVRQAVGSKRKAKKHLTPGNASALVHPPHVTADSPPIPRTDQQRFLTTLGISTPHEEGLDLAPKAPMPSVRKPQGSKETLAGVCGTAASVIPFCVDTSWEAFCSFLALMQGIREGGGEGNVVLGHTPNGATKASSFSAGFEGVKHSRNGSGDVEPESSSPGECSPSGFSDARKLAEGQTKVQPDGRKNDSQAKTQHGGTALEDAHSLILAPGPVQTEVWRCILKLLKVNLFHLTEVAAVRGACRDSDKFRGATTADFLHSSDCHSPGTQVNGVKDAREGSCIHAHRDKIKEEACRKADISQDPGLNSRENAESTSKDNEEDLIPDRQGMVLPGLDQDLRQPESGGAEDRYGVIREIHTALRALLEDEYDGDCPKTKKAAETVQVEAAEAFDAGFSLFFPSNLARVRLLQNMVKTISTKTAPPLLPQDTPTTTDNKEKRRRSNKKSVQRPRSSPKSRSSNFVQIAVEGLSRESYAAALVAWAFNNEKSKVDEPEIDSGDGTATHHFGAEELDTAMQSLLSYCADDLNDRLWGITSDAEPHVERLCSQGDGDTGGNGVGEKAGCPRSRSGGEEQALSGCPHSRLLLALQVHVIAYWGNTNSNEGHMSAARELSLAHASRLLQESAKVFTALAGDREQKGDREKNREREKQKGGGGFDHSDDSHADVDASRKSFVALLPLLCASIVAVPVGWKGCVSQASVLLPIVIPLIGAVDRFNRSVCAVAAPLGNKNISSSSSSSRRNIPTSTCWLNGLEESLAMLASDLACGLMDMNLTPSLTDFHSQRPFGAEREDNEKQGEDIVDLLLASSPFLAHDRENFDWSSIEGESSLQIDCPDFPQALEVISFQERLIQERSNPSPVTPMPTSGPPKQTSSSPSLNKPHTAQHTTQHTSQHSWSHGRRRASSDNAAKLSPIGLIGSASADDFSGQGLLFNASTRSVGSLGTLGIGDDKAGHSSGHNSGNHGSVGRGGGVEVEVHGGKSSAATGRQLDSIVDEDRAEGFIQDLLCGQGVAQALYQWMAVPLESQLPVLHATSLATQGQGWGSYQALSSQPAAALRVDEATGVHRRRRSRALSSDVDAAARALVAVMIKCNGAVTEAATFARCRLDRSSSPPPTLKLVAGAAVEVREVLAGLADSLEEEHNEEILSDDQKACDSLGEARCDKSCPGHRPKSESDLALATATLTTIVHNCRFLLKATRLPPIGLMRQADTSPCRRQSSAPQTPTEDQQTRQRLSHTLQRWSRNARPSNTAPKASSSFASTNELAGIVQHMAKGRVEKALSAAVASQTSPLPPRSASLESLLAFAASPIVLSALETRMRSHALRAKVRASGFRLVHIILQDVQIAPARRQIGARLAHCLNIGTRHAHNSVLLNGTEMGGRTAATGLVCSAFIELFRHVVNEAKQLNAGSHWRDKDVWRSTTLLVFLPLLQTLAKMLPPSFLHHNSNAPTIPEEQFSPGFTDVKVGASSYRTEHGVPTPTSSQGRSGSGCSGRASSTPSTVRSDADALKPAPVLEKDAFSVVVAAVSVLGAILGGRGDVLAPGAVVLGGDRMNGSVHHAAWRALSVVGIQVCSSAPTWTCGGSSSSTIDHHAHQAAGSGRSGSSSSTDMEKRHSSRVSREWWLAVQAIMSVVLREVARVQERLEQLLRSRQAEENLLAATRAVRLIIGPTSFPPRATLTFPGLLEYEGGEGFATSFWVSIPECSVHQADQRCAQGGENCDPTIHNAESKPRLRWMIFTRACQSSKEGGKTELFRESEECPGIFLTQLKMTAQTNTPSSNGNNGRAFHVEVVLETYNKPKRLEAANMARGDEVNDKDHDIATASTASAVERADGLREGSTGSEGDEDEGSNEPNVIFSKTPLPAGRWTHVCCAYSNIGEGGNNNFAGNDSSGDAVPQTIVTIAFDGIIVAKHVCPPRNVEYEQRTTSQSSQVSMHGLRSADGQQHDEAETFTPHQTRGQWQVKPVIYDLRWHSRSVSIEQARQLASSGSPAQQEDARHKAESYAARLVAFTEEIAESSHRAAASLSSPQWLSLWFKLVAVADQHAQRAILRLLRPLLCSSSSDQAIVNSDSGDGVRANAGAQAGGARALGSSCGQHQFNDRAVVDHLCELLGGPLIDLVQCQRGFGIVRGSDSEQVNIVGGPCERALNPVRRDPVMGPEIVLLLRSLVEQAPNRWQEHVFAALTDGLAATAQGELLPLPKSAESNSGANADDRSQQLRAWLGAATAAAYIGGGHIEGPRFGARVVLLPRPTLPTGSLLTEAGGSAREKTVVNDKVLRDVCANVCLSPSTVLLGEDAVKTECCGTVVGWTQCEGLQPSSQQGTLFVAVDRQYEGCLGEASDYTTALQDHVRSRTGDHHPSIVRATSCRVVAVSPRQVAFQAEVKEPVTSFLFKAALPSTLGLLESSTIPNIKIGVSADLEESSSTALGKLGASIVNAHIRCRLMRALAVQLRDAHQAKSALQGKLVPPLLALGASNLASAVVLALGSDAAVAFGRRGNFAPVVLSLSQARTATMSHSASLLADLESASQVVWGRLSSEKRDGGIRTPHQTCRSVDDAKNRETDNRAAASCSRPALEVLGGEALVEGNRVTASSHFPTLRLSLVGVGSGLTRGKWYYEVTLLTGGLMQLGWAGPLFQCNPIRGQGVGDHMYSWAFDGFRQKRWCVSSAPYGNRWRAGDVVGVSLDAGLEEMRFSLNGRDLGVAFAGVDTEGLYPAASMNVGQAASFNFGYSPFLYSPADSEGSPFQPVSDAVPRTIMAAQTVYDSHPSELGEQPLPGEVSRAIGEGRGEGDRNGSGDQNDNIHGLSPGRIRRRHGDGADVQARRSGGRVNGGGGGDAGRGAAGGSGGRTELERQGLVETLIGMGFPIEWAIRAAERSGAVMSESAATAWIIDRLEMENTKMEEEMGNMDTCEGDSVGGKSGTGDEYNDDDRESDDGNDDGNADVGGFGYELEATGVETGMRGVEGRADEDTGDRRWHDMYSAVRRSFLAHRTGQSPATAAGPPIQHDQGASTTLGAAAEATWAAENDLAASSQTVALLAAQETSAAEGAVNGQHGLMRAALSAEEGDLPSLSLVLDMALSILFSRAAIVNLLSHVRAAIGSSPRCPPRARNLLSAGPSDPNRAWWWVEPSGMKGYGSSTNIGGSVVSRASSRGHSWGSNGGDDCGVVMEIAHGILETMAVPDNQRRIIDLTKEKMSWYSPSRPATTGSTDTPTGTASTPIMERNRTLEEPHLHAASQPLGLFPRSCALAMGTFFELALVSIKSRGGQGTWFSANLSSAQCVTKDDTPCTNSRRSDEACWATSTPALTRLVTLFVSEAVSSIEHSSIADRPRNNGGADTSFSSNQGGCGTTDKPLTYSSNVLWAMWVLDALLLLENTHGGMEGPTHARADNESGDSFGPNLAATGEEDRSVASEDVRSLGLAAASARSPRAFAAVLRIAIGENSASEDLRVLGCSVCARMLDLSRLAPSFRQYVTSRHGDEASADTTAPTESAHHTTTIPTCGPMKGEFALPSQERSLARDFSTRLRNQVSMQSLGSPCLQSQLELLAQWELRRSTVSGTKRGLPFRGTHRQHDKECQNEGPWSDKKRQDEGPRSDEKRDNERPRSEENRIRTDKQHSVPEVWMDSVIKRADSWDVATTSFAGVEEAGENSELTLQGKKYATTIGPKRLDTAESEDSELSTVPTASGEDSSAQNMMSLLVETATATSVTVSWGGWLDSDHGPELQVGIGSNGIAYPVACGREAGASDLAQALRSKLSHAASRRRERESGLVLKVCASGLWGSEPYHVAAFDLDSRGCLRVHGLAADTHYLFRLEQRVVPPSSSRAPPPESADMSDDDDDDDDGNDDDNSCFPLEAAVSANSTGETGEDALRADAVVGASRALTGLAESRDAGGGETTMYTDQKLRQRQASCASSTRAAAGSSLHPRDSDLFTTAHTIPGDDCSQWPSMGDREQPYDTLENRHSVNLQKDFDVGGSHTTVLTTLSVATPPEVPFMLDADGCGPNLRLTKSNLTVTNNGRKKWSAVRATRGFSSGVHRWKVRVDRCVSKNVFVGVVSSESRLSNYVGSDRSGWGYLANKAIWHNKGKVRSYGDLFREGDTIGVVLNMDLGTLRFARNGRDLGVAVQGLEGTLYPAFSMYNRNDQLTLIPPEDHPAPTLTPSPAGHNDNVSGVGPTRVGGGADNQTARSDVLHGTFIAECVVRRASKALEILGVLTESGGLETPAGANFVEDVRLRLVRWSRGEQGRSLSSAYACAPVCLDTSQHARKGFFGLGAGDRVMSAEGEATVLGATKHSVWVAVEPASSPLSTQNYALDRGLRAWDSENSDKNQEDSCRGHNRGHASAAAGSNPSHRSIFGKPGGKTVSWSRSIVRHIVSHPEDFAISHGTTAPEENSDEQEIHGGNTAQRETLTQGTHGGNPAQRETLMQGIHGGNTAQREAGTTAAMVDLIRTEDLQTLLSKWTPAMDEELGRRLNTLAESTVITTSPLELSLDAVKNMPVSVEAFPLTGTVAPMEVCARAALLFHVNELVLPLLPLVNTSSAERGPLGALLHKCRHLILAAVKMSLLRTMIRPTVAELQQSEAGTENGAARTITLSGIRALPRTPNAGHTNAAAVPSPRLSWAQRGREVEKSVFGQVIRHLANRSPQVWSEATVAFSVELTDALPVVAKDGTADADDGHQLPDERALCREVFWQVCVEVCSPPISMFISTTPAEDTTSALEATTAEATLNTSTASTANKKTRAGGAAARDVPDNNLPSAVGYGGATPDPFFASNSRAPSIYMDPARILCYRSLGLVVGLSVRTGTPLPSLRLSPTWWMLVTGETSSLVDYAVSTGDTKRAATLSAATKGEKTPEISSEAAAGGDAARSRQGQSCLDEAGPAVLESVSDIRGGSISALEGVLAALERIGEAGSGKDELEKVLAEARFVAPLSNGQLVELLPRGADRPMNTHNLGEYRTRLARLRALEYAPQAAAFRAGLDVALPQRALSLLTWREMEKLVCG